MGIGGSMRGYVTAFLVLAATALPTINLPEETPIKLMEFPPVTMMQFPLLEVYTSNRIEVKDDTDKQQPDRGRLSGDTEEDNR